MFSSFCVCDRVLSVDVSLVDRALPSLAADTSQHEPAWLRRTDGLTPRSLSRAEEEQTAALCLPCAWLRAEPRIAVRRGPRRCAPRVSPHAEPPNESCASAWMTSVWALRELLSRQHDQLIQTRVAPSSLDRCGRGARDHACGERDVAFAIWFPATPWLWQPLPRLLLARS